ncbi:MAG: RHS repeat-associated core domain-containing protein [Pseudomonadota bacterium]|nr:RHS repeat-associated core domain-containing protein [Pseudomonadota bacterium]
MDIYGVHPTYGEHSGRVGAGNENPLGAQCPVPDPLKAPGQQCSAAGNPIDLTTGNKYQRESDYRSADGLLEFTRHFNSLLQQPSVSSPHVSVLGPNWRSTYDRAIRISNTGDLAAYVYREDGKILTFEEMGSTYVPDADITDRLEKRFDVSNAFIGWRYIVDASSDVETYDATGRLLRIDARTGTATTLTYDASGRLSGVSDSFGRALSFTHDASNRLSTLTDPAGQTFSYTYDVSGNVNGVSAPGGTVRSYTYNESGYIDWGLSFAGGMTGIFDESGNRYASFRYNSFLQAKSTEHAGGVGKYQLQIPSSMAANTATFTDPLGQTRTVTFATKQGVSRALSSSSLSDLACTADKSTQRDANGNVTARTDFNDEQSTYVVDIARNLETSRTEAAGTPRARTITTQWHPNYRLPMQIDEPGKRTSFTRDANGNALTRTELDTTTSVSRVWTYTYNSFGQVLTADGPRTDVSDLTAYTYYSCTGGYHCGQPHTISNAAGHVTTFNTYNPHGQPLTITDPNGVVTTLTYDLRQRLTSRTIGIEAMTFTYWPTGLLKKTTLPDGSYLEYTYDAAHRLTDINDADGNRIHYALDNMGNRTGEQAYDPSNALTRTRTRVFNALNRLQQEVGAAGTVNVTTTYGYDNNGNQTNVAAPLGRDTTQGYDELNRLSQITDPLTGVTQYGYNALDQLISVTDPKGLVTSYTYNALGDLQQQTSPDTGVTNNTYDSGGNLATSADARNAVTTYTYDALNRVATVAFSAGATTDQTLAYTYDAGTHGKGRLTGVSDSNHSLSWAYDDQGRVLTAGQAVGSVSKTTSYAYASGLRQSMTTPSGQVITYSYTNGKITSISVNGTVLVSNILYDPFGPVRQWTWSNGSLSVRTFDQDGKIAQLDSAGLKTYSYDDAFRITGITDTTNSALSWTYGYDDLDRLTVASKTGATLGYTYDANGNRLTQTGAGASTFAVAANSNRLNSVSGTLVRTYGYDSAGNTTSYTGVSFTYNNRGRMKSSTKNGATTNYVYNALGQLIKKGTNTLYYYDEAGHVIGIYNGSGALTEEIVWLGDTPIVSLRPKAGGGINIYNIHTDHLNTPRVITGSVNPGVRWRWDAEPFGGGTVNNNPSGVGVFNFDLRFPGQIAMAETGLYYNYYRDGYDPAVGRYTQSDPIGLRGGINTYAYAGGNPILHADPTGLDYWIEGPVKGEGGLGFHQSVCVGQYNSPSGRKCISFGVEDQTTCDGTKCKGKVYLDRSAAGDIAFGRYRRTTPEVDKRISAFFDNLLDREGDYDLINNNCRDFSYRLFRSLEHQFGGR